MVKNKAWPDSARLCQTLANTPVWSSGHSFILSLSLPCRLDPIKAGLTCLLSLAYAINPEGTPWILPRLDPGKKEKTKRRTIKAASKQLTKFQKLMKLIIKYCINAKLKFRFLLLNDILVLESKL